MMEDALTQSTNTATNYVLSFFKGNLLKELSNDIFVMFNMNINNKYTTFNVFNSL